MWCYSDGMEKVILALSNKLVLTDYEKEDVIIPTEVWNTSTVEHEKCLIGHVLSPRLRIWSL